MIMGFGKINLQEFKVSNSSSEEESDGGVICWQRDSVRASKSKLPNWAHVSHVFWAGWSARCFFPSGLQRSSFFSLSLSLPSPPLLLLNPHHSQRQNQPTGQISSSQLLFISLPSTGYFWKGKQRTSLPQKANTLFSPTKLEEFSFYPCVSSTLLSVQPSLFLLPRCFTALSALPLVYYRTTTCPPLLPASTLNFSLQILFLTSLHFSPHLPLTSPLSFSHLEPGWETLRLFLLGASLVRSVPLQLCFRTFFGFFDLC